MPTYEGLPCLPHGVVSLVRVPQTSGRCVFEASVRFRPADRGERGGGGTVATVFALGWSQSGAGQVRKQQCGRPAVYVPGQSVSVRFYLLASAILGLVVRSVLLQRQMVRFPNDTTL